MSSAAFAYPHKSAEAFRTISEVALELDVPQHVLRFWESRFAQIRPVKRAGGRRYYRPEDIDLLKGIRALLYSDGFTIKGVQKVLKERGLRHVAHVGRGGLPEAAPVPQVIEKIVYVEKPAPVKKARPTHLRAVPLAVSLPFFDEPPIFNEPEVAPQAATPMVIEEPMAIYESAIQVVEISGEDTINRERLEELLDEMAGLKARLQAARER
jgi:DNA-binding transcriptional MerR regulator